MEGKDSFILYTKYYKWLKDLSDEQLGSVFRTIFLYVSDTNPADPDNPIVNLAWQVIKNDLKDDLVKWKETCNKRAEAGRKGGLAKAENSKQNVANLANARNEKQNVANLADSDNEYDSEYDNDNEYDNSNSTTNSNNSAAIQESTPPVMVFECIKGETFELSEEYYKQLQTDYPTLNIWQELTKMKNWLSANNKKTKKGFKTFMVNWLNREVDRPKVNGGYAARTSYMNAQQLRKEQEKALMEMYDPRQLIQK